MCCFLVDLSSWCYLVTRLYGCSDGTFAVMKKSQQISSHAYFREDLDRRIESHLGSAAHLKCPLCKRIFKSPVVTPCCGDSFCRKCLSEALTTRAYGGRNKCPSCRQTINPAEIMPNKVLSDSVDAVFRGAVGVGAHKQPIIIIIIITVNINASSPPASSGAGGVSSSYDIPTAVRGVGASSGTFPRGAAGLQQQMNSSLQAASAAATLPWGGGTSASGGVPSSRHTFASTSRNSGFLPPDTPNATSSLHYSAAGDKLPLVVVVGRWGREIRIHRRTTLLRGCRQPDGLVAEL